MLVFLKYLSLSTIKLTTRQSPPHNDRGIPFRNYLVALTITYVLAMSFRASRLPGQTLMKM